MSKIGASSLRRTLFLIMSVYLQNAPLDEPVYQFMDRNDAQRLPAQFDPRKFFIRCLFTESRRRILPSAHRAGGTGLY